VCFWYTQGGAVVTRSEISREHILGVYDVIAGDWMYLQRKKMDAANREVAHAPKPKLKLEPSPAAAAAAAAAASSSSQGPAVAPPVAALEDVKEEHEDEDAEMQDEEEDVEDDDEVNFTKCKCGRVCDKDLLTCPYCNRLLDETRVTRPDDQMQLILKVAENRLGIRFTWILRGFRTQEATSRKRMKQYQTRAKKLGFSSCRDRFSKDATWRGEMELQGWNWTNIDTMDKWADEWSPAVMPMSWKERDRRGLWRTTTYREWDNASYQRMKSGTNAVKRPWGEYAGSWYRSDDGEEPSWAGPDDSWWGQWRQAWGSSDSWWRSS
jgi:hypothetical protein